MTVPFRFPVPPRASASLTVAREALSRAVVPRLVPSLVVALFAAIFLALIVVATPAHAQATEGARRPVGQLAAVRVSPLPAWQCAVGPALARTHGTDGLVCNAHFLSAAVSAAVVEGQPLGAPAACARLVAANVERAVSALVLGDTAAARRAEATPCDGRTLTFDSLTVDERALLRLCPGQVWSWVSRGSVACPALAGAAGPGAPVAAGLSAARDARWAGEAARRAASARRLYNDDMLAKARGEARRALEIDSLNADARAVLGASLAASGDKAGGAAELRRAVRAAPGDAWAWGELASALYWSRQDAALDSVAREALQYDGANVGVFWYAGQGALRRGDAAAAVAALDRAATLAPADARIRASRALAFVAAGRAADAETEARAATTLNPAFAPAQTALGRALEAAGKPTEARAAYERAHKLADWDPEPVERLRALASAAPRP